MNLLLDTSFLLELRRGSSKAAESLRRAAEGAGDLLISVLTEYELLVGAYHVLRARGDSGELVWLQRILRWVSVVPLTRRAVDLAARVRARAEERGVGVPDLDLLIACSPDPPARLLTCDSDHQRISDLLAGEGIEVVFVEPSPRGTPRRS